MKPSMKIEHTPCFETTINRAVFLNQSLVVYPERHLKTPDNITNVIRFLFGVGARVREDKVNDHYCLIIEGASYELRNALTVDADYTSIAR